MATGDGFYKKELRNQMEQLEKQFAGWGQNWKIKGKKQVKSPQKKSRLNKILLKHIMMLGRMKLVNLDTESQIRIMIKIFSLVKLKL